MGLFANTYLIKNKNVISRAQTKSIRLFSLTFIFNAFFLPLFNFTFSCFKVSEIGNQSLKNLWKNVFLSYNSKPRSLTGPTSTSYYEKYKM